MGCRPLAITASFCLARCVNESGHRLKFRVENFRCRRWLLLSVLADANSSLPA